LNIGAEAFYSWRVASGQWHKGVGLALKIEDGDAISGTTAGVSEALL